MGRPGRAASSAFRAAEVERDAQAGERRDGACVRRGRHLARYCGGDKETLCRRQSLGLRNSDPRRARARRGARGDSGPAPRVSGTSWLTDVRPVAHKMTEEKNERDKKAARK